MIKEMEKINLFSYFTFTFFFKFTPWYIFYVTDRCYSLMYTCKPKINKKNDHKKNLLVDLCSRNLSNKLGKYKKCLLPA